MFIYCTPDIFDILLLTVPFDHFENLCGYIKNVTGE